MEGMTLLCGRGVAGTCVAVVSGYSVYFLSALGCSFSEWMCGVTITCCCSGVAVLSGCRL